MPATARAVIVGSGIAGASIAYHLARLGWRELAVLERGELVGGTTSHAPGLVGQLRSSPDLTRMLMDSVALYKTLSIDGASGFVGEGSVRLASSPARWEQVRRQHEFARGVGLEAHLLDAREAARLFPLMDPDGVVGALHLPTDGSAAAPVLARALIERSRAEGVTFYPNTAVREVEVVDGRVRSVRTDAGRVRTETLVIAAGIWSPLVGRLAGVHLPLVPMQHQYVETAALPQLAGRTLPNLRDPDRRVYLRQRGDGLVVGGYERTPLPFDDPIPERPDPTVQPFEPKQFDELLRAAAGRVPALSGVELIRRVNGLEAFTPDGEFLLGPSPEVGGVWAACGFCAHGVSGAGGVGRVLAEWIANGDPGLDVSAMALGRFGGRAPDPQAVRNGACRVYGTYYDIPESAHP
jgi:glycine/D-amino acid oxidase-like deaminating enzyme